MLWVLQEIEYILQGCNQPYFGWETRFRRPEGL